LVLTDAADTFSLNEYDTWSETQQSEFIWSAALGMACLHNWGVLHNNLGREESMRVKDGRAQLCKFGLANAGAGPLDFRGDIMGFMDLFRNTNRGPPALQESFIKVGEKRDEPNVQYTSEMSFEDYIKAQSQFGWSSEAGKKILQKVRDPVAPFDLYVRLLRSSELWTSKDEPLDVPGALSQLAYGLDADGIEAFKRAVEASVEGHGFLTPDFLGEFPPFAS
jgi:hypothetical protein